MKPSLTKAVAMNVAAKLGIITLPTSFPYESMNDLQELHRQSILDQLATYKSHGIKWYRVRTGRDACPMCRSHAGDEFRVDEAVFGITLPPFCGRCHCSIVPADNE